MSLTLSIFEQNNCIELSLNGSALVESDFQELHKIVSEKINNKQANIILNLKNVKILNSLGINALIKILTKCRNNGGDMYIVNISEKINQVLLLTKLNTVLNIATSTEKAVENFS